MARQRLGQHFLVKGSVLDRIARAACPERVSLVIEIGPGKGALTERLFPHADRVVAVEVDPGLVEYLGRKFPDLTVLHANILETDLAQWGPAVIAGNLPYYIATPIIERAARLGPEFPPSVFLIQKEVAERLTAVPGSRDYGYLSVQIQFFADCELLFEVKPSAFHPPPKVDSAVVRLRPHPRAPELGIEDVDGFLRFLSLCFRQKRKTMRNNLVGAYSKDAVERFPEASLRAEQLSLEKFAELYRALVS